MIIQVLTLAEYHEMYHDFFRKYIIGRYQNMFITIDQVLSLTAFPLIILHMIDHSWRKKSLEFTFLKISIINCPAETKGLP